jgi:hypothetical protein
MLHYECHFIFIFSPPFDLNFAHVISAVVSLTSNFSVFSAAADSWEGVVILEARASLTTTLAVVVLKRREGKRRVGEGK